MAKLPKINQGNPRTFLKEFLKYLEFFWHNSWTRNARKSIKGT